MDDLYTLEQADFFDKLLYPNETDGLMKPIEDFKNLKPHILFTDIDDTLTIDGQLKSSTLAALERLREAQIEVIPITGRPAGWCEMIARTWPVSGVIGENGAFYFRLIKSSDSVQKMQRHFVIPEDEIKKNKIRLDKIAKEILTKIPGTALASDQFCRIFDLAIDFCEDVAPLTDKDIQHIVEIFTQNGATAKVSSIHVNGWFGSYDKLTTALEFLKIEHDLTDPDQIQKSVAFIGDSPNDGPMFQFFQNSFAVSNFSRFAQQSKEKPKFLLNQSHGAGFEELAKILVSTSCC